MDSSNTNFSLIDGKILLKTIKPDKKSPPPFGNIIYDQLILEKSKSIPSISSSDSPSVIVLCGPPGCGKSTIKTNLLSELGINEYINIDPDEIRTILMSQGVTFPDDKTMSGITNTFNKRLSDFSLENRYNILFDTTGQNFRAVSDIIYQSKQLGYKTYFVIIYASLETCQRRVQKRNEYLKSIGSGRIELPLDIAAKIYSGFVQPKGTASMFLIDYPVRADEVLLYNNNEDGIEPQLLYKKVGENVEYSSNFNGFYNLIIMQNPPFIRKKLVGGKITRKRKNIKKKKSIKRKIKKNHK